MADMRLNVGRYLIELASTNRDELSSIMKGARKKTIRVKLSGTELDVQTQDIHNLLKELRKSVRVRSWREVNEEEPLANPSLYDVRLAFIKADEYCKEERFWEAHVTLESVWRNSQSDIKPFLQAIIQLFATQVHEQMGNHQTAVSIYARVLQKLRHNAIFLKANQTLPSQLEYPLTLDLKAIAKSL